MHIPDGFARVAPYIFATAAGAYMDHLLEALEGTDTGRTIAPDGSLANGQIRFGDASIMISEAREGLGPSHSAFYLYVADANTSMARALEHGMTQVMSVADMPYGDRQGGARDRAGNIWWISQRLTSEPYGTG